MGIDEEFNEYYQVDPDHKRYDSSVFYERRMKERPPVQQPGGHGKADEYGITWLLDR